ncbi:CGNR zinc finger domain-containing protein [Rhizobium alvei]|uniref:CGNR zinc finger domain-containing protein n=1 Tax=Rhizobium alvei TaxID=1132659 RepID=A0ABT8YJ94_9HYPH|nr:CGNR zinc finger domain-containing protein [Rhizobium alvei]MDO6963701.1 CGNR zinc finger domain-containing protein [Rhizobium alvei]
MTFSWTPHRFAGGALALDVANSVILRHDAKRSLDRFAVPSQLSAFPAAAEVLSEERMDFGSLRDADDKDRLIRLREAIDRLFRLRISEGRDDNRLLADLLEALAAVFAAYPAATSPVPLDLAAARSALKLLSQPEPDRMKICGNCGWLFIDRSKNRSRTWCDMAVCGNRAKARLHYQRKKKADTA